MNKSIFKPAILFVCAVISFANIQAQIKPVLRKDAGKTNPAVKAAADKQAAIDKVLNATVSKVTFRVWGDNYTQAGFGWFKYRGVALNGNANNTFNFIFQNTNVAGDANTTWTQFVSGKSNADYTNYKTFLENGFTITINLKDRSPKAAGREFTANYSVEFTFTDGTSVIVPLQDIMLQGQKGYWKSAGDVNITKSFAGSVFPDPANPLVSPVIK